jgi:hypothetical protein
MSNIKRTENAPKKHWNAIMINFTVGPLRLASEVLKVSHAYLDLTLRI